MFIQTEDTPNPETLKFIPGNIILKSGTADFSGKEVSSDSPLASRLFEIDGVSRVFLATDFISVTKVPHLDWIPINRNGLTICDATSGIFAMDIDCSKLDVITWYLAIYLRII